MALLRYGKTQQATDAGVSSRVRHRETRGNYPTTPCLLEACKLAELKQYRLRRCIELQRPAASWDPIYPVTGGQRPSQATWKEKRRARGACAVETVQVFQVPFGPLSSRRRWESAVAW